jgi:hypothetical protein
LKAIFRDDPFNTSNGDEVAILVQFLGNDLRRHLGIKKSIPYDLTYDLVGSAVIAFGAWFETFKSRSPSVRKLLKDLVVALSSESILFGCSTRAKPLALALVKHCKFKGNFVIFPDGKISFGTGQRCFAFIDLDHSLSPPSRVNEYNLNPLARR